METLIILDTETTGTSPEEGHRIIEIGCVVITDRIITNNNYQQYIKPDRSVGDSFKVHEISDEFLADKPEFPDIADEFLAFVRGKTLVIHNAAFDVGFLDYELERMGRPERIGEICEIIDTLEMSRQMNPSARHSLDAICRRYNIDTSSRVKHGALLDASILAHAYLALTGGQFNLFSAGTSQEQHHETHSEHTNTLRTKIIYASSEEVAQHNQYFATS